MTIDDGYDGHDGTIWRHEKTKNTYEIIASHALIEGTLEPVVVYREVGGEGPAWVRPLWEFLDGRFTRLPDTGGQI